MAFARARSLKTGSATELRQCLRGDPLSNEMDRLSLFGLFAVTMMLVCYTFDHRSTWFILAFSIACLLASAYGFLQGAWPFGVVEAAWAAVAARRWWLAIHGRE
jgi:hypothetical protein